MPVISRSTKLSRATRDVNLPWRMRAGFRPTPRENAQPVTVETTASGWLLGLSSRSGRPVAADVFEVAVDHVDTVRTRMRDQGGTGGVFEPAATDDNAGQVRIGSELDRDAERLHLALQERQTRTAGRADASADPEITRNVGVAENDVVDLTEIERGRRGKQGGEVLEAAVLDLIRAHDRSACAECPAPESEGVQQVRGKDRIPRIEGADLRREAFAYEAGLRRRRERRELVLDHGLARVYASG